MGIREDQRIETPLGAPDDLVQSLASALLWVDTALMSLGHVDESRVRVALIGARAELRAAVRELRGPKPC